MNQLWNTCLHQKVCDDRKKECNKFNVPKLTTLAVVLTAVMIGNSAFALVEEDVNAPNSVQAPNINTSNLKITNFIGRDAILMYYNQQTGTGQLFVDGTTRTNLLNVTDKITTKNLTVNGQLNISEGLSAKNLDVQDTTISHVADATEDHQAVNLKQLTENNTQIRADAKTYVDDTATTLRSEAATESTRLDKAIADGDTATLASAKTHTDSTATALRVEAATESARLDKAIVDGNASTLASANKTTADIATAIRNEVKDADAKTLFDAKAHTNQTATNTLNTAKQYTDQTGATVLEQAKAYTDANANGSPFVALQSNEGDELAKAEGSQSIAIGVRAVAQGEQSIAIGVGNQVTGNNSGAIGDPNIVSGNGSYAVGNNNTVSGDNTFVLGNDVNTSATNAVVLGNASASDRNNTVSVGSAGSERQIIHVAAATADTDAVNLKQMKDADAVALTSAKNYTDITATTLRGEAITESKRVNKAISDGDVATLTSAKSYTDTRVKNLESSFTNLSQRIDQNNRSIRKNREIAAQGIAGIAAMSNIPMPAIQGISSVGVGMGYYDNESAIAIGASHYFEGGYAVKGAFSSGFQDQSTSVGVGVSYSWK
ncbi:hypothetical protein EAH57_07330 [Acinetobacter sp. 2JN-4]|uniref:YadA-like family protein n=1 Tax=Acinetobacter sp. 2JN-4 TaxID=2479844 RepID=UPI000EF9B5C4|nr:YadA-like family protein [Acinetobacter sp. 2JN-4]RLZ08829.1 hypothetical protein EAH57_07330 [Acinetobacter sp. 2JN-4]